MVTKHPGKREPRLDRWLARYSAWAARRPWRVLACAFVVLAASWGTASRLQVKGDFVSLLPTESGTAQRFRAALERKVAGASTLVVVVESPDSSANERFVERLVSELRALPKGLVTSVQKGAGPERRYFYDQRWLFASERDLRLVRCELSQERERSTLGLGLDEPCAELVDDELRELGATSEQALSAPKAPQIPESGSTFSRLRQRVERELREQDRFKSDYFRNPSGNRYAVLVRAAGAGMGDFGSDELLHRATELVTALNPGQFQPAMTVGFAGDIPNALAERKSLIADIALVSGLALLLILAVLIGYFRSALPLLHVGLSAALGCGIAFATAKLAFGHLNMASGFLGSIIAGNGINIPMIYVARYRELRAQGEPLEGALCRAAVDCRRGTWLGAVAAAGAYLSLGVTSFRGFSEFGLIGGAGSLACWFAAFGACPAAIAALARFERESTPVSRSRSPRAAAALARLVTRRPALVLVVVASLAVALGPAIHGYISDPWEYDFGKLRSKSSAHAGAGHASVKADEIFGTRGAPDLLLASDMAHAAHVADAVVARDRALFGGKLVQRVTTVYDYLGGRPEVVRRKLEVLSDIRAELDRALPRLRGPDLELAREMRPPERLRPLTAADLPALLRERFTEADGRFGTSVFVELDPTLSRSRGEQLLKIADLLEGVREPNGQVVPNASRATVFAEMIRSMTRDAPRTIGVAFGVVVMVSILATGSPSAVFGVLCSLLLGVWLTLGAAACFDVRLNFLNFVALPLTFGIGVEYAINLMDRFRALRGDLSTSIKSVGGAITACSMTTLLGYGTLLAGDNLALQSFGKYAVFGELSCLFTALFVLPAGLQLLRQRRARGAAREAPSSAS
ncbi:MAG: RND transporter [Myxococcales bacterium]|nr:MAG: RND transporter [Myxococcales bacterium]